jgi:hypothetical protein
MQQEKFEQWCLVELMGRQKIAGMVTERVIAGTGFLQVDVPETKANPAFTRLIHPNSLYAINPITEEVARMYAERLQVKPIDTWDLSAFMKKADERRLELQAGSSEEEEDDDDRGDAVYEQD